jgi:hypothetical protein
MPIGGYRFSKVVMNQWVANAAVDYGPRGIRVNCLNPGPTASAMMPAFHANAGKDVVDGSLGIIMRYSDPVEQAWPLVCLNSPRFSYVTGEALWADGGFLGAVGAHGDEFHGHADGVAVVGVVVDGEDEGAGGVFERRVVFLRQEGGVQIDLGRDLHGLRVDNLEALVRSIARTLRS